MTTEVEFEVGPKRLRLQFRKKLNKFEPCQWTPPKRWGRKYGAVHVDKNGHIEFKVLEGI